MIDTKNKVLFIHVPRTAGSNFCNMYYDKVLKKDICLDLYYDYVVGEASVLKHLTFDEYKYLYRSHDINTYKQVGIVRNIFDLVVSVFYMTIQKNRGDNTFYHRYLERNNKQISLQSWIDCIANMPAADNPKKPFEKNPRVLMTQTNHFRNCSDQCTLIDYEDYDTQVNDWFKDNFNEEQKATKYNPTGLTKKYKSRLYPIDRPVDYRDCYTDSTASQVAELFVDEIEVFKFTL